MLATSFALAVARGANDEWVLTGLCQTRGEIRAYLMAPASRSYLTLRPGEERWGWRLTRVDFTARCVWLTDSVRELKVSAGAYAPGPDPGGERTESFDSSRPTRPAERRRHETAAEPGAHGGTNSDLASANPDHPPRDTPGGSADETAAAQQPATSHGRRPPTADELFKVRNGYGAWEALLRRRQGAEATGLPTDADPPAAPAG